MKKVILLLTLLTSIFILLLNASGYSTDPKQLIIWQNQSSGDIVFWHMDGTTLLSQSFIENVPDTNWNIAATNNLPPDGSINLPKTGQTTSYATGDDGDLEMGVAWPPTRFSASGDCVTDNLTGLMWAKKANLPNGTKTWQQALDYVASMNSGAGLCGHHD